MFLFGAAPAAAQDDMDDVLGGFEESEDDDVFGGFDDADEFPEQVPEEGPGEETRRQQRHAVDDQLCTPPPFRRWIL